MQLENKIVWVTGSAKRLGRAIALELARRGADIVVHCNTSRAEAESAAGEIRALGRRALVVQADLTDVAAIRRVTGEIEAGFGALHVLVNCAANFIRCELEAITEAVWDDSLDANLKAPAFCALEAARLIRRSGGGKILNFADWSGFRPYKHYLPYMVSKGGVITLTQALAVELAPEITVNAIAPGTVLLPPDTPEAEKTAIERNIPLDRIGGPEDIVAAVVFFLESGDWITGQVLCVDGGRLIANAPRV